MFLGKYSRFPTFFIRYFPIIQEITSKILKMISSVLQ